MSEMIAQRYQLGHRIGSGGMGIVYQGTDTHSGQTVAVKVLNPLTIEAMPTSVERFVREAEALRKLNHPNIVKVLDYLEEEGKHYIVMEYVGGGSLYQLIQQKARLPIDQILTLSLDLADALTRSHRLQIVHRDLKPANVLIAEDGTPRLSDFGIASVPTGERVTQSNIILGTADYLPPEAILGINDLDHRADIWAFGVMLFEMMSGYRPFKGDTAAQVIVSVANHPIPDLEAECPDAPVALVDLVYRMLEKDREQRISSVRLVGAELEAILRGAPSALPVTLGPQADARRFEPPTDSFSSPQHNLPAQITSFIGREAELDTLEQLMMEAGTRHVTVLGPGGIGKTRFALEAARRLMDRFPNGVYLVELAPLSTPEYIARTVTEAIGFRLQEDERVLHQQLMDYIHEKQILLILDNFEHLIDGALIVTQILQAAPGVRVLVTSRERLNLNSETIFNLEGMDFPERDLPLDGEDYSALRLFVQGARRVQPGFELHPANLPDVARICQIVRGMPLGILLASAWVEMLSPGEIAEEISRNLDFLETDQRDIPQRQRSIRAVFDSSWQRLNEREQEAFRRMAVFRGGFSRRAAQDVTDASLRTLTLLVNKSLLRRDPDTGHYTVHELLRQYVEEQLEQAGDTEAVRTRHMIYYLNALAGLKADLRGQRQLVALDEIESDFENVRVAWAWAIHSRDWETIDNALESLSLFCHFRNRTEGITLFETARQALAPAPGETPHPLWGRLLPRHMAPGNRLQKIEQALEIARQYENLPESAFCLWRLAGATGYGHNYARGLELAQESLALYQQLEDSFGISRVLHDMAYFYGNQGQIKRFIELTRQSIDIKRSIGDRIGLAHSLYNLGASELLAGNLNAAEAYYRESLAIRREMRDLQGVSVSLSTLSAIAYFRGALDDAQSLAMEALAIATDIHNPASKGYAQVMLGLLKTIREEDYATARNWCEEGSRHNTSNRTYMFLATHCFIVAYTGLGEFEAAQQAQRTLLQMAMTFGGDGALAFCLPTSALIIAHDGQNERAVELLGLACTLPANPLGWIEQSPLVTRLRDHLENTLGSDGYERAWSRGAQQNLRRVTTQLLQELD